MRLFFLCIALVMMTGFGHTATINVPGDYSTIQLAIDAAAASDLILVQPNTYPENIDFKGKAITVTSSAGAALTVIDGAQSGSVVTFNSNEGPDSVLSGFTLTNGTGTVIGSYGATGGGGIYCSGASPFITENIIEGNAAYEGGGLYFNASAGAVVFDNVITDNSSPQYSGGGIHCAFTNGLLIEKNIISSNIGKGGGGIYSTANKYLTVRENTVTYNEAPLGSGGGMSTSGDAETVIEGNLFMGNSSKSTTSMAGNLYCSSSVSLVVRNNIVSKSFSSNGIGVYHGDADTQILNNTITDNYDSGIYVRQAGPILSGNTIQGNNGRGVICMWDPSPRISNNIISENQGGIYAYDGYPFISGNVISDNSTSSSGGGICLVGTPASDTLVINNIITGNKGSEGGGVYCYVCDPTFINNTISENTAKTEGGAIFCDYSEAIMVNSILWGNEAPLGPEISLTGGGGSPATLTISYSVLQGGWNAIHFGTNSTVYWGQGMIETDPLFTDPLENDFHLLYKSPCLNTGDNTPPTLLDVDFEGDPRITYGTVDMGADEFHTHLYFTGDLTPGGAVQVKVTGKPKWTPVFLWVGSGVLDVPLSTNYGDWYLAFPLLVELSLGAIPFPGGILALPAVLPPDLPAPMEIPMQGFVQNELTNCGIMKIQP